jgi:NADPH:quinone reductase-like Zn-dependent oxidoreductase
MTQVLSPLPPTLGTTLPASQWALMTSSDKSSARLELSTAANIPTLKDNQILVRTSHVALNAYDWANSGQTNHVIGRDGVGSVMATGRAVRRLQVGQRVS